MVVAEPPQKRESGPSDAAAPVAAPSLPQIGDPRRLSPAQVLALQRSIGNGAVEQMLSRAVRIDGPSLRDLQG